MAFSCSSHRLCILTGNCFSAAARDSDGHLEARRCQSTDGYIDPQQVYTREGVKKHADLADDTLLIVLALGAVA
jgi:hypothetical protein